MSEKLYELYERFCIMTESNISESEAFKLVTENVPFGLVLNLKNYILSLKKNK